MQGEAGRQHTADLCSFLEINHFEDEDVKKLFAGGITSSRLLEAAHLVRKKEKSPLLKLNLNIESDEDVDRIENLQSVLEIACSSGTMKVTLDCIENVKTESIMLKVQAPFSALMMLLGSNRTFKWICSYPAQMHRALRTLTEKTAAFCIEAISKGMSIVSLADPSGMLELLGEKRYKEFCAFYVLLLVRKLSPYLDNAAVHICPRTSLLLERYELLQSEVYRYDNENYAEAVLELSKKNNVRVLGHKCINDEFSKDRNAYILTPNHPQVQVRLMKENDWEAVSRIYGEGINTRNITIVKELPEKKQWFAEHKKCLVAEYLGNIIGFAAGNNKMIPEISVYIENDFHHEGVGSKLLTELQNQTDSLRSVIFESNIPSIRLHEKMGFKKTVTFYFENDARRVLVYDWEASNE